MSKEKDKTEHNYNIEDKSKIMDGIENVFEVAPSQEEYNRESDLINKGNEYYQD